MIIEYIQGIYCCDVKTSYDKSIYQKYSIDFKSSTVPKITNS